MRQIHDSLEALSWEKQKLYPVGSVSLLAKKNEIQKLDDKARQIPTTKDEHNSKTDAQQPWKKYEGLWKHISIIPDF